MINRNALLTDIQKNVWAGVISDIKIVLPITMPFRRTYNDPLLKLLSALKSQPCNTIDIYNTVCYCKGYVANNVLRGHAAENGPTLLVSCLKQLKSLKPRIWIVESNP